MKIHVEFLCDECGAEGEGFRDESEIGIAEDCWKCGGDNYRSRRPEQAKTYHQMAQAARDADEGTRVALALVLLRIYEADRTRNCGLVNGEADLCRAFSTEAKYALEMAGVLPS